MSAIPLMCILPQSFWKNFFRNNKRKTFILLLHLSFEFVTLIRDKNSWKKKVIQCNFAISPESQRTFSRSVANLLFRETGDHEEYGFVIIEQGICNAFKGVFFKHFKRMVSTAKTWATGFNFLPSYEKILKMSSPDAIDLVQDVERVLKKCFIISAPFKDIEKGIVNERRRRIVYLVVFTYLVDCLLSIIRTLAPEDSSLHMYSLNSMVSFGYLGRLFNAVFIVGIPMVTTNICTLLLHEKRGTLTPVTSLTRMFDKLPNPSTEETKTLTSILKLFTYIPYVNILTTCPLLLMRIVGAFAAVKSYGLIFLLCYIPLWIIQCVCATLTAQTFSAVHLLIAQSVAYLTLRLKRLDAFLLRMILMDPKQRCKCKFSSIVQGMLLELDTVLKETNDHNRCIRMLLKQTTTGVGITFSLLFVFAVEASEWYQKAFIVTTAIAVVVLSSYSFINAVYLFIKIRSTAKLLHSLQTVIHWRDSWVKNQSAPVMSRIERGRYPMDISKSKYQILRMIHRMSSPYLRIGFTEGDGDSFSPASLTATYSTMIFTSMMFLNTKYSSIKHILSH